MAQTSIHHSPVHHSNHLLRCLQVFLASLLLLLPQASTTTPTDRGFTVELIHRYSERSPLDNGKLTQSQLLQRLLELSRSRAQWQESNLGANVTVLRPLLAVEGCLYLVPLSIGTGQGMRHYNLLLDTGSSLIWTQCEPCDPCFNHPSQIFDPNKSPTYRRIPESHHLCAPPYQPDGNGNCAFELRYGGGSSSQGVLSQDTFTFQSDRRGHPASYRLVFGCAHSATMVHTGGKIDGIMGMGSMPESLPRQLHQETLNRFSYCLVAPGGSGNAGFLQFGFNFHPTGRVKSTPITTNPGSDNYYLRLIGVSINDRRLPLSPETFALHGRHGGCFIDTGLGVTNLIRPAYDEARNVLVEHFQHLTPVDGKAQGIHLEHCYETPRNYENVLPHMTFHFQGADYRIGNEKLFVINPSFFCWAMDPSDHFTILGVHQQYNVRFLYDIARRTLSFSLENCSPEDAI